MKKRIENKNNVKEMQQLLSWESSIELIQKLMSDGYTKLALFIGCECYLGLNSDNVLQLKWCDLTSSKSFILKDMKTKKVIDLHVCNELRELATSCFQMAGKQDLDSLCFIGSNNKVLSKGQLKTLFAEIKLKYRLEDIVLSIDIFQVVFGRHIVEKYEPHGEMALCVLSHMFNHPNIESTRRYLGI